MDCGRANPPLVAASAKRMKVVGELSSSLRHREGPDLRSAVVSSSTIASLKKEIQSGAGRSRICYSLSYELV